MDLNWIFDILLFLPVIGYFCWHNIHDYNDFCDCVTAIGANDATIFVPNHQDITANLTIDANIALEIIKGGGFNISEGVVLTIEGWINAGAYQIFFGDGADDVVLGAAAAAAAFPEWWTG